MVVAARIFSLAKETADDVFAGQSLPLSIVIATLFALSRAALSPTTLLAMTEATNALSFVVLISRRSQGLVAIADIP